MNFEFPTFCRVGAMVYELRADEEAAEQCMTRANGQDGIGGSQCSHYRPHIHINQGSLRRAFFTLIHEVAHALSVQGGFADCGEQVIVAVENAVIGVILQNDWSLPVVRTVRAAWESGIVDRRDILKWMGDTPTLKYENILWKVVQTPESARHCRGFKLISTPDFDTDVLSMDRGHSLVHQFDSLLYRAMVDVINDYDIEAKDGWTATFGYGFTLFFIVNEWIDSLIESVKAGRNDGGVSEGS